MAKKIIPKPRQIEKDTAEGARKLKRRVSKKIRGSFKRED
jgi:hypothetical protein